MRELIAGLEAFRGRQPGYIDDGNRWESAVCICLVDSLAESDSKAGLSSEVALDSAAGLDIIFEVRPSDLFPQPGDICLPGGMVERSESPLETAYRELKEEILVDREQVEYLGPCDIYWTNLMQINPFLMKVEGYQGGFDRTEVQEVFRVPLQFFLDNEPEAYTMELKFQDNPDFPYHLINGGRNYKWWRRTEKILFYQYGGYTIWGLTAKIIHGFVESLRGLAE